MFTRNTKYKYNDKYAGIMTLLRLFWGSLDNLFVAKFLTRLITYVNTYIGL